MAVIKVSFDKTVQEFEIGGKVYELHYDDANIDRLYNAANNYQRKVDEVSTKEISEQQKAEECKKILRELIDVYFGEGAYDEIYLACNKSVFNMSKVVYALFKWSKDKFKEIKKQNAQYYLGNNAL